MADANTSDEEIEELNQLSNDLKQLDDQSNEFEKKITIYRNNKIVFLLQSFLLGASYSMIWPTVYPYVRDDLTSSTFVKIIYGLTYVAYPIASMLSAKLVEKTHLSTKKTILLLNFFEIAGNIIYTLKYHALLPCLGRFMAGMGDAFYIVLMKEMKTKYDTAISEKITVECLASFILGVIFAPGINIATTFLHFKVGSWVLNANNFPGLTMACLFLIAQFIILIFVNDDGRIYNINKFDESESDDEDGLFTKEYSVIFLAVLSFFYTYVVATLELMVPLIAYEICKISTIGSMLLYAVIATIYAILLLFTMTLSFKNPMDLYLGITVFMQTISLSSLLYLMIRHGTDDQVYHIIALALIVIALASMWSNDDILFINFVQTTINVEYRKTSHELRKVTSRLAFCLAGVTVPFTFTSGFVVLGPILIVLIFVMFIFSMIVKYYSGYQRT